MDGGYCLNGDHYADYLATEQPQVIHMHQVITFNNIAI